MRAEKTSRERSARLFRDDATQKLSADAPVSPTPPSASRCGIAGLCRRPPQRQSGPQSQSRPPWRRGARLGRGARRTRPLRLRALKPVMRTARSAQTRLPYRIVIRQAFGCDKASIRADTQLSMKSELSQGTCQHAAAARHCLRGASCADPAVHAARPACGALVCHVPE